MTGTTPTPTLEDFWPLAYRPESDRAAWMAGAQAVLVLLGKGATADDLQREVLLWARTHIGRAA